MKNIKWLFGCPTTDLIDMVFLTGKMTIETDQTYGHKYSRIYKHIYWKYFYCQALKSEVLVTAILSLSSELSLCLHSFLDPVQIMNNLKKDSFKMPCWLKGPALGIIFDSSLVVVKIVTSVNTPGVSALPQPRPQLTTPARTKWSAKCKERRCLP